MARIVKYSLSINVKAKPTKGKFDVEEDQRE